MKKKHSVFGLSSSEIHRLLDECMAEADSSPKTTDVDAMAQLLRERLADRFPAVVIGRSFESWILDQVQRQVIERSGKAVLEILTDPAAALPVVEKVKERYKLIAQRAAAPAERQVATSIYFAAVAYALIFHGQRITQHADDYVIESFGKLAAKPWMTPELVELFMKAKERLKPPTEGEEKGQS